MRDTRGYTARRLTGSLWVPAGLARGRAAGIVAAISTLALIAVIYLDFPLTGAPAPVATASGLCLTAAATVPTGAGASRGCTGASAAGADLPHRAGSAESSTATDRPVVIDRPRNRVWPALQVLGSVADSLRAAIATRGPSTAYRNDLLQDVS